MFSANYRHPTGILMYWDIRIGGASRSMALPQISQAIQVVKYAIKS